MSIQDERELRGRLGGLLDSLDAAPAPVDRAMRRGRVIRMRRWVSAAAGVAVVAAGAVVLPTLIQGHRAVAPAASQHYTVTAQALGPTAKGGVIGAGTINSKRWRVVLNNSLGRNGCSPQSYQLICGFGYGNAVGPREVSLDGGAAAGGTQFQFGTVGSDVTRVVIRLSNGAKLTLRPVSAGGRRWVAAAAPLNAMIGAESFVGASEYLHAVPHVSRGFADFVTWLRPGQHGLRRDARQIGSGVIDRVIWHSSVEAGPWGYCVTSANGNGNLCIPTATGLQPPRIGKPLLFLSCGPLVTNRSKQVAAFSGAVVIPAGVKNLVLKFADGRRLRLVAVSVGGVRAVGYALPKRPNVVRTLEYGFAGQLVASLSGVNWGC